MSPSDKRTTRLIKKWCPARLREGHSPFPIQSVLERNTDCAGRALMPQEEAECEALTSALSRDCGARQVLSRRWRTAKSGTDRGEATGTGPFREIDHRLS